ncbi:hypothetical protein CYMTET_54945, partial [Cymbomonas tetramitiformis]
MRRLGVGMQIGGAIAGGSTLEMYETVLSNNQATEASWQPTTRSASLHPVCHPRFPGHAAAACYLMNTLEKGGAVFSTGTSRIYDSNLTQNSCEGQGGVIFQDGWLYLFNTVVTYNKAGSGGFHDASIGNITIDSCYLSDNTASSGRGYGGALNYYEDSFINIINSTLTRNKAEVGGGAISSFYDAHIWIYGSLLSSNLANDYGGAVDAYKASAFYTLNSRFEDNRSGK